MSAKNRADLITKLHRVAKKSYEGIAPPSNRSVLEHMLYGCCLEDSPQDAADEAMASLQENFCDWNEVRVTTVEELAEVGKKLTAPKVAAISLKKTLFGIFEKYFTYDIDFLKKENLGKAVQTFESFKGVTPFVVSYVAQNGLGGHSIPVDRSMMSLFFVLGIVSEEEAAQGRVPGLERAIPKAKGVEFFSVVHQLAVDFAASPFSTNLRDILTSVNPEAKERFPKRPSKKKVTKKKVAAKAAAPKKTAAKKAAPKKATTKKGAAKAAPKKKTTTKKATKKPASRKGTAKKKSPTKRLSRKKPK